ncbi:hypothetical protein [Burkholderia multivorans]|uniref:hypothetical protein n=1 Tax=Burkholderia multivorans TaxID=87883 RepID=UPI0020B21E61|nr:hypothetical protein [Burkholderia multivorans]
MNDQQQSRADALTNERRIALGTLISEWLGKHDSDGFIMCEFDYTDSRNVDMFIDEAIAPAIADAVQVALAASTVEQPAAAPSEETIRFCPECGRLGDIPAGYEACCPDWSQARIVPKRFAELCAETFRLCVTQPFPQSAASPADGRATCTHQWTWADGKCADCGASTQQPTPTGGMTLGERIAHVGGRVTDGGTVEFGSAMALDALVQHVLRDTRAAASATDDRAAKISDYLNAPGMWAQVYCGAVFVRGCPSDVARSAADAAVKEFGDAACKTVADLTHTLDEVLRVN